MVPRQRHDTPHGRKKTPRFLTGPPGCPPKKWATDTARRAVEGASFHRPPGPPAENRWMPSNPAKLRGVDTPWLGSGSPGRQVSGGFRAVGGYVSRVRARCGSLRSLWHDASVGDRPGSSVSFRVLAGRGREADGVGFDRRATGRWGWGRGDRRVVFTCRPAVGEDTAGGAAVAGEISGRRPRVQGIELSVMNL